ncbi:MAG: aminotransferase class I/II-fold pyridoxal phosphate-dependent enzyme [Gemmatimonadaceae bacterium]
MNVPTNPKQPTSSRTLTRQSYGAVSLYAPDRTAAEVDLSDNTNLWGVPPAAADAISRAPASAVTRYPNLYANELKLAIGEYLGVSPEMVVTGCGSDDVLDSTIRAFGEPGDLISYPDPSFAMVPIFASMNGLLGRPIPLTADNDADAAEYISAGARINYLCTPNNPTGASFSRDAIEQIVSGTDGLVIIDEAYAEFASDNCLELLTMSPRVVLTRTLSKAFGLAGMRVGYAIGDRAVVAEIEKSRGPYKVSSLAERAAVAALTDGMGWVEQHVCEAVDNRRRFTELLISMGMQPLPSDSNFVLIPVVDALEADRRLRTLGIAVRPFRSLPRIGDALRISIGPWWMMERCALALREIPQ